MAFRKGKSKTGGRKAGTPNKATVEIKELARSLLEDPIYQTNLRKRLRDGEASQIEQLLYHYAYGKPTDNLKVGREFTLEELVNASMNNDRLEQGGANSA
jgi:hypothetical protein